MSMMTNEDGDLCGNETVNEGDKSKNLFPKLAKELHLTITMLSSSSSSSSSSSASSSSSSASSSSNPDAPIWERPVRKQIVMIYFAL